MLPWLEDVRSGLRLPLLSFTLVGIANFSQGLFCGTAAHEVSLRMKYPRDFE
jgi:hypothetical protein